MTAPAHVRYSYSDYLHVEDDSPLVRHEYVAGEIYAMAGGTPEHARLIAVVIGILVQATRRGPCVVYSSDLRVRIDAVDVTTYPDVSVICGAIQSSRVDRMAAVNPTFLVEVTSDSTEAYDRGEKLRYYQAIGSLREILIVSHRERRITLHQREKDARGLPTRSFQAIEFVANGEVLLLESVGVRIALDDVYGAPAESVSQP